MGGSTAKKGVGGRLLEGGENGGKMLYEGFDRFGGAGGVGAVVNGKIGLERGARSRGRGGGREASHTTITRFTTIQ